MKELSIEEKAKRYDELKVTAQELEHDGCFDKITLFDLFPELKESEDEMMRQRIIQAIRLRADDMNEEWSDEIAWLEKQGEQKPADVRTTGYWHVEDVEQKPADKVEPKFKVGEWLCENKPTNYAHFIQILEIVNVQGKDRYRISRDLHNDEDVVEFGFIEKYYHKFDIQDAKAGDVLVNQDGEMPFIFKECKNNHVYCFCGYTNRNDVFFDKFVDSEGEELHWLNLYHEQVYPATKEQHDTLEKAMADVGYTFDFEKKELKKIEQKSDWSEKYIADVFEKVGLAKIVREQSNDNLTNALQDAMIELSKFIPQSTPAWSEEDEQYLLVCKNALAKYQVSDKWDATIISRWLENKLTVLQPKQEWSEEDETMVTNIIIMLKEGASLHFNKNDIAKGVDWLKSLRPQSR